MKTPPFSRVGPYRLVDFVGAGGMGEVYRAVHETTGQLAAVKFLSGAGDAKTRQRFANEARVQESLHHPGLVAFYGWHECGASSCIVMEYADGQTFGERIKTLGQLAFEEASWLLARVCEAIGYMHARGVVHRDIKSSNVKITTKGEVKLLDFGIAKAALSPQLTATNSFIGTLQYLAPEQVKSGTADARSDVWALGVLFYEMLSGRVPFDAPTLGELCEKISRADYPPIATLRPDTPRVAQHLIARCLKKNPADRYQNANELLSDVNALLAALKAEPSPRSVAVKRSLPRAVPVAIAATVGVVLLVLAVLAMRRPNSAPEPMQNGLTIVRREPKDSGGSGELKTVRVDVFEGARQTRVYRDGELLGRPPCEFQARIGDRIELKLERDGFRSKRELITVTASQPTYSYVLEPLSE